MTLALGSLCFENIQAAASDWVTAYVRCINTGRRLPSMGEIGTVYAALGGTVTETNWSDDATSASTHFALAVAGFALTFQDHPNGDSVASRCVIAPHNNLGPAPTSKRRRGDHRFRHACN